MSSDESSPETKSRAGERKLNREKHKAIQNGTYQPTLLEKAKEALKSMKEPSFEMLVAADEFKEKMSEDMTKKLKIFIQNLKQKNRKQQEDDES